MLQSDRKEYINRMRSILSTKWVIHIDIWEYYTHLQMRVGGSVKTQLSYDRDLLVWRWLHVSAVLGHLQVISFFTINNNKEKTYTLDKVLLRGTLPLSKTLSNVFVFSLLLLIVKKFMTWRWPSTAETCSHRQTNKSRSYDSCVLTDPPTLICIKTQRGWWTSSKMC